MTFSEQELNEVYWADSIKTLPSGILMLQGEINKALKFEGFSYFESMGTKAKKAVEFTEQEVNYYTSIFYHCEDFGLPNGRGWHNELPWLIGFLSYFKGIKKSIEVYYANKR
jgi:hypothetical protein